MVSFILPGFVIQSSGQLLYDCLYAVSAAMLGVYILAFYVLGRSDARKACCHRGEMSHDEDNRCHDNLRHINGHVTRGSVTSLESHAAYSGKSHNTSNGGPR